MDSNRWQQIELLVQAALEVPLVERAAWLSAHCDGDELLREEVTSLLEVADDSGNFLRQPVAAQAARVLLENDADLSREGQTIGNYKVVRELGRGGMGVVYLAAREDEEFRQHVAIKLVKRGLDTEDVLRRFRNERQILASLNHPNIASLHDGGTSHDGLPYFVMEYVQGLPLLHYCVEKNLSIHDRLQLFQKICGAVQYAHQNLIIHRDLKPSNILVTHEGEVKLLDFGVAKLLNPDLTGGSITHTRAALRVMTPDYASPEQIRGQHVTTATDVYSLGIILYELLTGAKPYKLKDTSPEELSRAICEAEPSKPSTTGRRREAETATPEENEDSSSLPVPYSPSQLRGDIDTIVLMALRKDPERRYKSVEQFSDDIERHLNGLPVSARKDTPAYRTAKFVGRNRVAVFATSFIVIAIIAGLVVALWQAGNARRQRDLAQREKARAEGINQFLQRMLSFSNQSYTSVAPVTAKNNVTVNEMLERIGPQIEIELAGQPEVRAQVLRTIGSSYASQGRYAPAEKYLREALELQAKIYGEDSLEASATMTELGVLTLRQLRFAEANPLLEKAVAFYRKQQIAVSGAKLAQALDFWAVDQFYLGHSKESLSLYEEALRIAGQADLKGNDRGILASIKTDLGGVLVNLGDLEKGEPLLRESLAEYRQISSEPHWEMGATLMLLGVGASNRNQPDEALRFLIESEQIYRQTLGDENIYIASNLSQQATALLQKNDLEGAEKKTRQSLVIYRNLFPGGNLLSANELTQLGKILTKEGRATEGEDSLRQALAILEAKATKAYDYIVLAKISLSQCLLAQRRYAEAEKIALEAKQEVSQNLGPQSPLLKATTSNLAKIYEQQEKPALALRKIR
jgi:serine/threonine-protein kinase